MLTKNNQFLTKLSVLISILILDIGSVINILSQYQDELSRGEQLPKTLLMFLFVIFILEIVLIISLFKPGKLKFFFILRKRFSWLTWIVVPLIVFGCSYMLLATNYSHHFSGDIVRLTFFLAIILSSALFISRSDSQLIEWPRLLTGIVLFGAIFTLAYAFRMMVDHPFRLQWSEGNRFFDYSLMYGKRIYDHTGMLPSGGLTGRGRSSIWGLPFLFDNISIQFFRFWNELVFVIPGLILGLIAAKNTARKKSTGFYLVFTLWGMLFLDQGPIYAPLILAAWLVALTRFSPLWLGFLLTVVAGFYAEASRFTWMFAPAIWSGLIAFTEISEITMKDRWKRAILLAAGGLLGGFILPKIFESIPMLSTQAERSLNNTANLSIFHQISRQPLLWERLLPNPTYAPGLILGLIIASGPVLILLWIAVRKQVNGWSIWQVLAAGGSLGAFLVVGLIISVKIGGGSNLHNLDMFLITVLFLAIILMEGQAREDYLNRKPVWPLAVLVVLSASLPFFQKFMDAQPLVLLDEQIVDDYLIDVVGKVEDAKQEGEVLFIDQRQLLTFKYVTDVPLVNDYEKKLLMDMAMAGEADYFAGFYEDLKNHRFSMIINEPSITGFRGEDFEFGNENDAWVKWVSLPLLCYYQIETTHAEIGLEILYPKSMSPPIEGMICP